MVASVQELILAAQSKQRPSMVSQLGDAINSGLSGYSKGLGVQDQRMDIMLKLAQAQAAKEEAARKAAAAERAEKRRKEIAGNSGITPATPADRLKSSVMKEKVVFDADGGMTETFETEPEKTPTFSKSEYFDEGTKRKRIGKWSESQGLIRSPEDAFADAPDIGRTKELDPSGLRKEFTSLSKDFFSVNEAVSRVRASSKDPSAAGDLALIFNYMKILDPGSTVREGEFANAQNAAGIPDQIRNLYNRAKSGERLNPNQRADFTSRAERLFEGQKTVHDRRVSEYSRLANDAGIDPSQVIVDFSVPYDAPTLKPGSVEDGYEYIGGDPAQQGSWRKL